MPTTFCNIPYLKDTRAYLRKNMTDAERVLWSMLKGKKFYGRRFRRQHSLGYYIVDFYCSSEKLVIELDGQHHFTAVGKAKDKDRDDHLKEFGIKVLRFENKEVLNDLSTVLRKIRENFKK
jgi:very-short-patch-repair endonuclease